MPLDVAMGLLGAAREAFGLVTGVRAARQAERDRAADYFAAVGATLAEIAAEIGAGRTPYGRCGELAMHADHFIACTDGVVEAAEAQRLAAILHASHDIEGMAIRLSAPAERAEKLAAIAEASGRFSAMAHIVRAGG